MRHPLLMKTASLATQAFTFLSRVLNTSLWVRYRGTKAPFKEKPLSSIEIEWGIDMDTMSTKWSFAGKPEREVKLKGRCKRCWGSLLARSDEAGVWTGMKCRVCGWLLEGEDAAKERARGLNESIVNLMNIDFGRYSQYAEGAFSLKIFPQMDRLTEGELRTRIGTKVASGSRAENREKLTRSSFPLGSPGWLYLQANTLMSGVEQISNLDQQSVAHFPDFDIREDGTVVTYLPMEGLKEDPQFHERQMARTMGSTMIEAMVSAFACELAMKAICLTCKDEAIKNHDLLDLFNDLPEDSRLRIRADYPEIEELMERARQVFGAWRYFERDIGESGLMAIADLNRAQALSKAARVILDEATIVGLGGTVKMNATRNVRVVGEQRFYKGEIKINMTGSEWPPRV